MINWEFKWKIHQSHEEFMPFPPIDDRGLLLNPFPILHPQPKEVSIITEEEIGYKPLKRAILN